MDTLKKKKNKQNELQMLDLPQSIFNPFKSYCSTAVNNLTANLLRDSSVLTKELKYIDPVQLIKGQNHVNNRDLPSNS